MADPFFVATCPHCGQQFQAGYAPGPPPPARRHGRDRSRGLMAHDLDGLSEVEQLRLMLERFRHSPAPSETAVIVEYAAQKLAEIERSLAAGRGKTDRLLDDLAAVEHLDDPSLADISEALTGSREYGGGAYTRIKKVKQLLDSTTTTPADEPDFDESDHYPDRAA